MILCSALLVALCTLCTLAPPARAQMDRTREDGASGSELVEAVLSTLQDACIFADNSLFLRRVAYVETLDGTDPATYTSPGYYGGIWKVDQPMFLRTQIETGRLTAQYDLIRSKLGIDWLHVTWADLRKPLTSGLAAALFLTLEDAPGNVPVSVTMQATYWLQHYRMVHTGLTEQNFTDRAETLERGCARTEDLDLVFVVGTSNSVGPTEWSALQRFVSDIIINLSLHNGIGQTQDRVAMVTYSDSAMLSFDFDTGSDFVASLTQVTNAQHLPGRSNLTAAFILVQTQVLNKARPDAVKVVVLVTDKSADDRTSMVMALVPLKLTDVTLFTVGVGSQVARDEMEQIASTPTCSHAYHVDSYQQLNSLELTIEDISCRVPLILSTGVYTYPCGYNVLAQVPGSSVGSSITISTNRGTVQVFGSHTSQLPSPDIHDINQTATDSAAAVIYTRDLRPLTLSLESERSRGLLCSGNFTIRVDDHTAKRTDCNKRLPDFVFLLDATLATSDNDWTAMLDFVQIFVQQFDIGPQAAQVALVSFTDTQTTHFRLGQLESSAHLLQALRGVGRLQGTSSDLPAALTYVANQVLTPAAGARADASKTLILVTPGRFNDPFNAVGEGAHLHGMGTRIAVVAVGSSFDDVNLNAIASGPQHVEKVSNVLNLTSTVKKVIEDACGEVSVLCVEGGISRECNIEDLLNSQYGNLVGPELTVSSNPCAMQLAAGLSSISIDRFPHPTDPDKFLLCDSAGQVYIVLCPLTEVYNAVLHECRAPAPVQDTTLSPPAVTQGPTILQVLTSTPAQGLTTTLTPSSQFTNPCTPDAIIDGYLFHPYPPDPTQYYHCGVRPYTGRLESCPPGKVWRQLVVQCMYSGVIVNLDTNEMDPQIPNPCIGGADYFPSPNDPNAFIQCNLYHEAFLKHCPVGQVWNAAETTCDYS